MQLTCLTKRQQTQRVVEFGISEENAVYWRRGIIRPRP